MVARKTPGKKRWLLSLKANCSIAKGDTSVIPWAKSSLTLVTKQLQDGGEHQNWRGSSPLIFGVNYTSIFHVSCSNSDGAEFFFTAVCFQHKEPFLVHLITLFFP